MDRNRRGKKKEKKGTEWEGQGNKRQKVKIMDCGVTAGSLSPYCLAFDLTNFIIFYILVFDLYHCWWF